MLNAYRSSSSSDKIISLWNFDFFYTGLFGVDMYILLFDPCFKGVDVL